MIRNEISRRVFLKAGGLGLVSLGLDPLFLDRAAYALSRPSTLGNRRKTLICIFQRGAVDGLNMLVPHGDPHYYRSRGAIAIPRPGTPGGALDLDGHFGLHPELAALLPLYRDGSLCAIHAVGSPSETRSHFEAQDYMETGTPDVATTPDGWINRHLAHHQEHTSTPFRGVAMGPSLPRALQGSAPGLAVNQLETFGLPGRGARRDRLTRSFEALYAGTASGIVASSSRDAFEAERMLRQNTVAAITPAHGAEYPDSRFGRTMRQLAALIKADLGMEIGFADVGGWDTHVNQGSSEGQLAVRLRDFGQSIGAFVQDLGDRMADVVILTMSEFGRTVAENGSRGTDHGHGTAMMVIGGGVRGGRVAGDWPTLAPEELYQRRDLAITTDFRDLFTEVLVRHLGQLNPGAVFPGYEADVSRWVGAMEA